ncbi:hypothetical protein H6F42_09380 [Pseudanabaena sp. FACHB-1998]|nr:hypothetical protein [Pseudanabaena sp. FACHB-1998]MBD2177119.1 hypothetical protein [Pseudanabaena sp. FACHB-1998]
MQTFQISYLPNFEPIPIEQCKTKRSRHRLPRPKSTRTINCQQLEIPWTA